MTTWTTMMTTKPMMRMLMTTTNRPLPPRKSQGQGQKGERKNQGEEIHVRQRHRPFPTREGARGQTRPWLRL